MNKKEFFDILKHPERLEASHLEGLEEIMAAYPYFQAARVLHLKLLKEQFSFRYNRFLRITAVFTQDRSVLFDYIRANTLTDPDLIEQELDSIYDIELVDEAVVYKLENQGEQPGWLTGMNQGESGNEEETATGVPEAQSQSPDNRLFNIQNKHTFCEWLRLSALHPIDRGKSEDPLMKDKQKKREIIDRFILNSPRIERKENVEISLDEPPDIAVNKTLITETLAHLYEQQGKYKEALQAYEILSLKFPEKSSFFASRIQRLKNLK